MKKVNLKPQKESHTLFSTVLCLYTSNFPFQGDDLEKKPTLPEWTMQGVVFQVHLWTLNWSSHAEELTRSKCNECDGNLGLYLQHFFSFILTSVFFASAEFAEPLSIWVLDMLKCVLSLPHRRPGWSENRGIRHIAASVYGFFFFFLHYVKNAAFFLYPWWQHARCNHKREGRRWKALPHHLLAERHCVYKSRIGRSGGGFLLQPGWLGSCDTTSSIAWYYPDSITLTWLWIKNYLLDLREGKWWVSHQQLLRTHRRVHGAQPDRESAPGGGASLVGLSLVQLRCLLGRLVSFQAGGVPVRHSPPPLTVMLRIDH